ncbi:hypothetical protein [Kitasatospora fiedleri]|uniref:hypothetical protein n=1 Tax=Kitasatospora fiedleri TaxID=2991545 RepID=UPI00249AFE94|nr:hypothetical protein [Kitasatospora fiedleri]
MINQLAGVLLGGGAGTPDGTGTDGAADPDRAAGGSDASTDTPVGTVGTVGTTAPAESSGGTDDAYLERSRSAAARRGHPDAPEATVASAASAGAGAGGGSGSGSGSGSASASAEGAAATGQRAPLREEGGYQVPSPFLRAALSRLAAPAAD